MLALDHVSKTYPNGVHELDQVSLKVELGEILAIVGGSVQGKSVLMRVITGLVTPVLPLILSFAAGAMIYVVVEELIPEAQNNDGGNSTNVATIGCMLGFAVMMVLDVALG